MKELFPNVIKKDGKLYTKVKKNLREWDPEHSKLAAAILNGLRTMPIKPKAKILYLGAASGTTVSYCSDIVEDGIIYAVEFSPRVFPKLTRIASIKKNIAPIFADARKPTLYNFIEICDVIYVDIADPQETEIGIKNAEYFLKDNGYIMIAIKSQSIDVIKKPEKVYKEEIGKLKKRCKIIEIIDISNYQKHHAFIVAQFLK